MGKIVVELEVDKKLYKPEYDQMLLNEFLHKFGPGTCVVIEHIDEIPRERSGQYMLIKKNVIN